MPEEEKSKQPKDVKAETTNPATTGANTGGQAEKPLTPEEVNRVFEEGEVKLDANGKPISQGTNEDKAREGATLRKPHAWWYRIWRIKR